MFHGQGGYDWETVYNMPIWLRKYTFKRLKDYYEKQSEANAPKSAPQDPNKVLTPGVIPKATYTTKTSTAAKK